MQINCKHLVKNNIECELHNSVCDTLEHLPEDKYTCYKHLCLYLQGLNLDDCNSTYHQIQRSLVQGPYQDVINNDDEDIQLEKP